MKYLGIDYGTKKVGLARSNEEGTIAFPHAIVKNDNKLLPYILTLLHDNNIDEVVIGESVQLDGTHNSLMNDINQFVKKLSEQTTLVIHFEKEWMSSLAARSHMYSKGNIANEPWSGKATAKKRQAVDAQAAAIILQRFLDKK